MKLRDPARPALANGQRLLTSGGPVPTWYLLPAEVVEGKPQVKLIVFLLVSGHNSFRDFSAVFAARQLSDTWLAWEDDPELCCQNWFGYSGPTAGVPKGVQQLPTVVVAESLEDLGL